MNTKLLMWVLAGALIVGGAYLVAVVNNPNQNECSLATDRIVSGVIADLSTDGSRMEILAPSGLRGFSLDGRAIITDVGGRIGTYVYLKRGLKITAHLGSGCAPVVTSIAVTEEPNIIVTTPVSGAIVKSPIIITGIARVFENQFGWRVKDVKGNILSEGNAYAESPDAGQYGPFAITGGYSIPRDASGTIEVFDYSAKGDGSYDGFVSVPVTLSEAATAQQVNVFFVNNLLDTGISCRRVFPLPRTIPKTEGVARAATEELLKGPTDGEKKVGYSTAIPAGAHIQRLTIQNGSAAIDFDEALERGVAGSCRVMAIRSQIEQTLLQLPTVKQVVISIDGRTEDILQP